VQTVKAGVAVIAYETLSANKHACSVHDESRDGRLQSAGMWAGNKGTDACC
jgi:hypothetical protein